MLLWALVGIVILAAIVFLVIFGIAAWVAYPHTWSRRIPVDAFGHPSQLGLEYEDVAFRSLNDKLTLRGWYLPAGRDDRCIILIQGQDHHRNSPGIRSLHLGADLVKRGFSVLLFDFRGRGESEGKRGSAGDREQWDTLGAIAYVQSRSIPTERIGLLGFSIGAAVAIMVAAREPRIPAIVADSAFVDYMQEFKHVPFYGITLPSWFAIPIVWAGSLLFGMDFGNVRPIKALDKIAPRPIFFIHAEDDQVISPQETVALYNASGNKQNQLWIAKGARHAFSYSRYPQEYADRVAEFFDKHIPAS